MSAIGPKQTATGAANVCFWPKADVPRSLQRAVDVVIWMMFAVAPALAVSALKGPPKTRKIPDMRTHANGLHGKLRLCAFYEEATNGHRYR